MWWLGTFYLFSEIFVITSEGKPRVTVVTVATDIYKTEYKRFLASAKAFRIDVRNIGKQKGWNYTSIKVHLLRKFLNNLEVAYQRDHIVLLVDSYDVLFLAGLDEIVKRFQRFPDTKVLFSGDHDCYPAPSVAKRFPKADKRTLYPYLNSGGIIGYSLDLKKIVNYKQSIDARDDQLYYTLIYVQKGLRKTFKMTIDHNATVFLTLAGSQDHIKVINTELGYLIENTITKQRAPIVHGQGPTGKAMMKRLYKLYFHKKFG